MAAAEEEWAKTGFTENLGEGRDVHDALLELFMNAVDAEQEFAVAAGEKFQMPTIEASPAGTVVITNRSVAVFDEAKLILGRQSNVKDDPKKMGRYSMGLKDAIAILTRHGCQIELAAHDQRVRFRAAAPTGLMLYRVEPQDGGGGERQWRVEVDSIPNVENEVADVKGHFVEFFMPALVEFHRGADSRGTPIVIYKFNSAGKNKNKVPCFRGPKKNGGLFVGRRFVKFPHPSVLTVFGYHFPEPTAEMKKLIDRNQTLPSFREAIIYDALHDLFQNDELVAKVVEVLPDGPAHELSGLIPRTRWPSRALETTVAVPAATRRAEPRVVRAATPAGEKPPLPVKAEAAGGPRRPFLIDAAHVNGVVKSAKEQMQSIWKKHGVAVLNELNDLARATFTDVSTQVVPYGSIIYEVATPRSDVDVTLMVFPSEGVEPGSALATFAETLQGSGMNVDASALEAEIPVLKVQKDTPGGVPFHVDISVNNHSAVHKSHALRDLLNAYRGADDLALLVKLWAAKCGFRGPPYLSSHGWMLVVARFCAEAAGSSTNYDEVAFFTWFQKAFPPHEPWVLGMRAPPFEDEEANPAARVDDETRKRIVAAAGLAERNLREKRVPWAAAAADGASDRAATAASSDAAAAAAPELSAIGDFYTNVLMTTDMSDADDRFWDHHM